MIQSGSNNGFNAIQGLIYSLWTRISTCRRRLVEDPTLQTTLLSASNPSNTVTLTDRSSRVDIQMSVPTPHPVSAVVVQTMQISYQNGDDILGSSSLPIGAASRQKLIENALPKFSVDLCAIIAKYAEREQYEDEEEEVVLIMVRDLKPINSKEKLQELCTGYVESGLLEKYSVKGQKYDKSLAIALKKVKEHFSGLTDSDDIEPLRYYALNHYKGYLKECRKKKWELEQRLRESEWEREQERMAREKDEREEEYRWRQYPQEFQNSVGRQHF